MDENTPQVSYAKDLAPLADILGEVKRPGDFFATGSMETPMPLLEVKDGGTVSFPVPVPAEQCRKLIESAAERPLYGRGDQTLHDESVRKVWQIAAGKVRLSGKAWSATLKSLLARVTERKGRPHTLVCTKTHTSFYKKCKQHRADKSLIKRLLSLADAGRQPSSLVERLEHAVRRTTPTSKNLPST